MADVYPLKFRPIYKEKIWGGRNLHRLFGRDLPDGKDCLIGESWELADLDEGVSVVSNGPAVGATLTEIVNQWGQDLILHDTSDLSRANVKPKRFPLLLKLLDANDTLSLQVHPDERAAAEIGPPATAKTECWYIVESRHGAIYKGVKPGIGPEQFRKAVETDNVEDVVQRIELLTGDFHFLPAGTIHAAGKGLVIAEVQTPSDTTYRVTDWGRGREIHVAKSLQCVRFDLGISSADTPALPEWNLCFPLPANAQTLLRTKHFVVAKVTGLGDTIPIEIPAGGCTALMSLSQSHNICITHEGASEPTVIASPGDTVLLPAGLKQPAITAAIDCKFLFISLPQAQ